ncbi:carboxypeptidase-like regulatory domain-containing protein [Spongiivirga sp. MCCC 1A20706]|uniref:carboxypeptidase-like regulatory domain-containing protein n=1 Tax=Spongiivirga sp. MCCC 1A20706 TaxID=3160963 RepID=UPI0039776B70
MKLRHPLLKLLVTFSMTLVLCNQNISAFPTTSFITKKTTDIREIKGEVIDADTKKPLVFATLNLLGSNISSITNTEGKFVLKVPSSLNKGKVLVSFLGYKSKEITLSQLSKDFNTISLTESVTELKEISVISVRDAANLVREVFKNKADNYLKDPTTMTAFYRESIKRRNRNVMLSEAVVNIYKQPYTNKGRDNIKIYKARKSTDYRRLDTVAFKLQGGPFNSLFLDVIKYPEYIFNEFIDQYNFNFDRSTEINGQPIYVINFAQKKGIDDPLYKGELFIEPKHKVLVSAVYSLNITDSKEASKLFVRKKPRNASVYPKEVVYRVDYKESQGKWHYSYGNAMLKFKIDWDKKLFNSTYTMNSEMAITDWQKSTIDTPKRKDFIKSSIILSDETSGFSDPDFWGDYNIIEPEKNIESAIKKIRKQLERTKAKQGSFSKP